MKVKEFLEKTKKISSRQMAALIGTHQSAFWRWGHHAIHQGNIPEKYLAKAEEIIEKIEKGEIVPTSRVRSGPKGPRAPKEKIYREKKTKDRQVIKMEEIKDEPTSEEKEKKEDGNVFVMTGKAEDVLKILSKMKF